jgi:hypothetical protein
MEQRDHPELGALHSHFCWIIANDQERGTLEGTELVVTVLFAGALGLGFYNCWKVLYKQKQHNSFYMTLIYVFGQAICVTRIVGCALLYASIHAIHSNRVCRDFLDEGKNFSPDPSQTTALRHASRWTNYFYLCVGYSMLFKLIFGAVTMAQMASFAGKLKVIAD